MRVLMTGTAIAVLLGLGVARAQPSDASPKQGCFFVSQFDNWRPADNKTFYIRVSLNRYFRVGTAHECPALLWPQAHLIMNIRGPNTICAPIDWELKVSTNPNGMVMPCIVKSMTELSPAEVQDIPPKFKP